MLKPLRWLSAWLRRDRYAGRIVVPFGKHGPTEPRVIVSYDKTTKTVILESPPGATDAILYPARDNP